VALERWFCSCAELQVLSSTAAEKSMLGDVDDLNKIQTPAVIARQGAEGNSRHSDTNIGGTFTIVYYSQKLAESV
jgi:hypothetical protein